MYWGINTECKSSGLKYKFFNSKISTIFLKWLNHFQSFNNLLPRLLNTAEFSFVYNESIIDTTI
jgi:hypothetical protein